MLGGRGAIGEAVADGLGARGDEVLRSSRSGSGGDLAVDPFGAAGLGALDAVPQLDAVVWAQGTNAADSIDDVDLDAHLDVFRANCLFVTATLAHLLLRDRIASSARLVVVSSVWQELARSDKLSYMVSKAAVGGLVRSAAVDLAGRGILMNAVLPGATDTPMTRAMLSEEQVAAIAGLSPHRRLADLEGVVGLVIWLASASNTSVTGLSIPVDLGFSVARLL